LRAPGRIGDFGAQAVAERLHEIKAVAAIPKLRRSERPRQTAPAPPGSPFQSQPSVFRGEPIGEPRQSLERGDRWQYAVRR
jgi:hypothetical protein